MQRQTCLELHLEIVIEPNQCRVAQSSLLDFEHLGNYKL